ncbi:MAG: hypothetical protein ABSF74_03785 [Dehalococcoidia bacterium]|jgi:hypothetical protein
MDDIEKKISELTDRGFMTLQYGLKWAKAMDRIRGWEQAAKHGESPTFGPELLSTQQVFKDNREAFIDKIPLFLDSQAYGIVDLIAWNNQQMIALVRNMISQESKKANEQP